MRNDWRKHLNLGLEISVYVAVFAFIGYYLDKKTRLTPVFTVFGTVMSFLSVFYVIWKRYIKKQ